MTNEELEAVKQQLVKMLDNVFKYDEPCILSLENELATLKEGTDEYNAVSAQLNNLRYLAETLFIYCEKYGVEYTLDYDYDDNNNVYG